MPRTKKSRSPSGANEYPLEYDANGKAKRCRAGYNKTTNGTCKKTGSANTKMPTPPPVFQERVPTPQPAFEERMPTPPMQSPDEYNVEYDTNGKAKRCRTGYNKTKNGTCKKKGSTNTKMPTPPPVFQERVPTPQPAFEERMPTPPMQSPDEYNVEYDANGKAKRCRTGYNKTKNGTCKKKGSTNTKMPTPPPAFQERVPTPQQASEERVPSPPKMNFTVKITPIMKSMRASALEKLIEQNKYDPYAINNDGETELMVILSSVLLSGKSFCKPAILLFDKLLPQVPSEYWNIKNNMNDTILHYACDACDTMVKKLVDIPSLDLGAINDAKRSPFYVAVAGYIYSDKHLEYGMANMFNTVIATLDRVATSNAYADGPKDYLGILKPDHSGDTVAHFACKEGYSNLAIQIYKLMLLCGGLSEKDARSLLNLAHSMKANRLYNFIMSDGSTLSADNNDAENGKEDSYDEEEEDSYDDEEEDSYDDEEDSEYNSPPAGFATQYLKVNPGDNFAKMKAQYFKLMLEYHPDKCNNKHPELSKQQCAEITQKINNEYDAIKQRFGQAGGVKK